MTYAWIKLPEPPQGRMWCVACVAFGKARINKEYGPQIVALENDGKDENFLFEPQQFPHLELATVRGLCAQLQQFGIVDLCWTHVAGVEVRAVSPLDPAFQQGPPVPAGLLKGGRS